MPHDAERGLGAAGPFVFVETYLAQDEVRSSTHP
jgi:hypothetical protein